MVLTIMSLGACGFNYKSDPPNPPELGSLSQGGVEEKKLDTGFVIPGPNSYDSADTAVLVDKNKTDNTVTLYNYNVNKNYTLSVEGTTLLYDKYGEAISLEQIEEGAVVDVTFLKSQKRLNSMQLSKEAWVYESVSKYEIDTVRHDMSIGESIYKFSEDVLLFSGGRQVEMMDLNAADIITVKGIDSKVLSINVDKGHGYLRLANDQYFVGGWIEIGQSYIRPITEDMLLTVPEGSYQVLISHNGGGGIKNVIINRNEEITLDIGDLEVAEAKYGMVLFSLSPSKTVLYVDGELVDTSAPVNLEYGIHQIIAKADGYKSITTYIKVAQESAGIDVILDSINSEDDDDDKDKDNDTSTTNTSGQYKVYVDAPETVEVYLDGNYVGISPCNFAKVSGSHIITLRKTGYTTRSYTVQIDEEEKDINYSFGDLMVVPSVDIQE